MLEDGVVTTIIGMSVVFMFLTLLVVSMTIMSKVMIFINKIFPEQVLETVNAPAKKVSSEIDEDILAVIAVAKLNM